MSPPLPRRPSLALASPRRPSLALVRAPRAVQAREQMKRKKEDEDEGITLDEDSWDDSEETAVVKIYNSPVKKRIKILKEEIMNRLAEMLENSVIEEDKSKRKRETDLVEDIGKLALREENEKSKLKLGEENEKLRNEKTEAIGINKQIKGVEERILEVRRRIGMLKSRRPAKADPLNCDFYMAKKENVVSIAKTSTQFKSTSSLMAKRAKCVRL